MAKRKQELDWFRRQTESPDALTALVANFRNAEALYASGESASKWNLMEYKEQIKSAMLFNIHERAEMMNEQQYINHATSMERDQPISHGEARKNWATWAADPAASGLMWCSEGGVLKFRVVQGTNVDKISQLSLEKVIALHGKSKKTRYR